MAECVQHISPPLAFIHGTQTGIQYSLQPFTFIIYFLSTPCLPQSRLSMPCPLVDKPSVAFLGVLFCFSTPPDPKSDAGQPARPSPGKGGGR